jgi:hypothetical protein
MKGSLSFGAMRNVYAVNCILAHRKHHAATVISAIGNPLRTESAVILGLSSDCAMSLAGAGTAAT